MTNLVLLESVISKGLVVVVCMEVLCEYSGPLREELYLGLMTSVLNHGFSHSYLKWLDRLVISYLFY